jgi:hypothetical protein
MQMHQHADALVVKPINKIFALSPQPHSAPYPPLNSTQSTVAHLVRENNATPPCACADQSPLEEHRRPALAHARVGCRPEERCHPSLAPTGVGCRP